MGLQDIRNRIKKSLNFKEKEVPNKWALAPSDSLLPTELWIKILADTEKRDIIALSLTCRAIRWISLPWLFQQQSIYPFSTTITFRRLDRTTYRARTLDRMAFLSSPRIAELVKEFLLVPYPIGHAMSRRGEPHLPENDLVDRTIAILPLFVNLTVLVIQGIRSTPLRMKVLRTLSLVHFTLETRHDDISWLANDEGALAAPIPTKQSFSLNRIENLRYSSRETIIPLDFLYPDSLAAISAGVNGTPSVLVALSKSPSLLANLSTLEITVRFITSPEFHPALATCPGLRTLRLRSTTMDGAALARIPSILPIPADLIPQLNTYQGPPPLAECFIGRRPVRQVNLWSSRAPRSVSDSAGLVHVIPKLGEAVKHLELGSTDVSTELFESIRDNLHNLTSLSINPHLSSYHPGSPVTKLVAVNLQLRLTFDLHQMERLAIGIQIPQWIGPGSREETNYLKEVMESFPQSYNPFSWQVWSLEEPWCKLIWHRLEGGRGVGSISIERVTYERPYFPVDTPLPM